MKRIFFLSMIFAMIFSAAEAQIPQTISYQGFYTDANGVPVNDGTTQSHTLTFYFFKGDAADTSFSRTINNVKIAKGLFGVIIGRNLTITDGSKNKPLPADIWHDPYKIQVGVDVLPTGDKFPFTAVPYALTAANVPAANITGTNTLPATVLPTTVPIGNGVAGNLTLWTGTVTVGNDTDLSWNSGTNTLSAANFSGNGSALTSLTAGNITGANTLPAAVLPTTVPIGNGVVDNLTLWTSTGTVGNDTDLTWNSSTNTLSATNFSGNFSGSGLTLSMPAANLTGTNTLPAAVLPTTVPIGSGATNNLTLWTGAGTVGNDTDLSWNSGTNTLSATNFSGNGSAISTINASNISSGTINDARLETTLDRTIFNASDFITAVGGLNIGGTGDPNNNLVLTSGSLGIGGAPSVPLHVRGNAALSRLEGTNSAYIELYPDGVLEGSIGFTGTADDNLSISNTSAGKIRIIRSTDGIDGGSVDSGTGEGSLEIGSNNVAQADNSVVIGSFGQLMPTADGSMYLTDNSTTTLSTANTIANRFYARFAGGFFLYSNSAQSVGVGVPAGGTSWASISDSTRKENFRAVDGETILRKIDCLRLETWNYKFHSSKTRHYGPTAQEFFSAFGFDGLGYIGNDTTISTQDIEGLNLTAIKALVKRTDELKKAQEKLELYQAKLNEQSDELVTLKKQIKETEGQSAILSDIQAENKSLRNEIEQIKQILGLEANRKKMKH